MAKAQTTYSILSDEEKARRIARATECVKAEKAAKEAGFTGERGKGYWKAVHAFCEAHGIAYPEKGAAKPRTSKPKARKQVAKKKTAKRAGKGRR